MIWQRAKRRELRATVQSGFTLIELLISMMILILVGSVMLMTFFSALKGTNKAQSLITLRQDGNYALSQMTKLIRTAGSVSCSASNTRVVTITTPNDNLSTTYTCDQVADTIASQSANGTFYLLRDAQKATITACSFTCGATGSNLKEFVALSFTLTHPDPKLGSADFSTTVILRNTPTE